ncbi:MAG: Cytochrome c biogenesis protein CcsA [Myxococcota bacterium]|nr:Cytochrome c biogenesis protein CcsA [Myxococcota bacterium]
MTSLPSSDVSMGFFAAALGFYVLAFCFYLALITREGRGWLAKAATFAAWGGVAAHGLGLLRRWYEAGADVVHEYTLARGHAPEGPELFWRWIGHPPWTNLFESLVFFCFGMMIVWAVLDRKFQVKISGLFSTGVAITALGLAFIAPGREIQPLVRALRSGWLLIHVLFASLAYPLFLTAAVFSFFYIIKTRVSREAQGIVLALIAVGILLAVGRGTTFVTDGYYMTLRADYEVPQFRMVRERLPDGRFVEKEVREVKTIADKFRYTVKAPHASGQGKIDKDIPLAVKVSGVPWLIGGSLAGFAAAIGLFFAARRSGAEKLAAWGRHAFAAASALFTGVLGMIVARAFGNPNVNRAKLPEFIAEDSARKFNAAGLDFSVHNMDFVKRVYLSLQSNPYDLALLLLTWVFLAFFVYYQYRPEKVEAALPDAKKLDVMSYKIILAAFPLMAMLLATGAVWAHVSWGRYWGWDPKETWALITWFVYAIYLHARITHGWVGKPSALIAIAGFAVVVFTYMGVNLGLTGEGLHVYGNG